MNSAVVKHCSNVVEHVAKERPRSRSDADKTAVELRQGSTDGFEYAQDYDFRLPDGRPVPSVKAMVATEKTSKPWEPSPYCI